MQQVQFAQQIGSDVENFFGEQAAEFCRRLPLLSPREKEVMYLVGDGKPNKIIAAELNISPKTVEIHRSNMMRKMQVNSLAELVRMLTLAAIHQSLSGFPDNRQ